MAQQEIFDLEKKITDLKFLERDLIRERDILRFKSLEKAEKSVSVVSIAEKLLKNISGAGKKDIIVNSFPSKYSGREDDEFLSEVRVELRYRPSDEDVSYSELSLNIYLVKDFQDEEVAKRESEIMDKLIEIRKDIEMLKSVKKNLRNSGLS